MWFLQMLGYVGNPRNVCHHINQIFTQKCAIQSEAQKNRAFCTSPELTHSNFLHGVAMVRYVLARLVGGPTIAHDLTVIMSLRVIF